MDFLRSIKEWIVGAFVDSLVAEKVSERLHLLVVASTAITAAEMIEKDCFWYKTHYSVTVNLIAMAESVVTDLRW